MMNYKGKSSQILWNVHTHTHTHTHTHFELQTYVIERALESTYEEGGGGEFSLIKKRFPR